MVPVIFIEAIINLFSIDFRRSEIFKIISLSLKYYMFIDEINVFKKA